MAIPYLNGHSVKPAAVNSTGQVMFTDEQIS